MVVRLDNLDGGHQSRTHLEVIIPLKCHTIQDLSSRF
jgi:hypothetical protein